MSGNVYEWCWNWYDGSNNFPKATPTGSEQAPCSSICFDRVWRGGYWSDNESYCRVSDRDGTDPSIRYGNLGFRVACKGE
jgi:formylglycine-generating enzyme required for sulfatase activity